MSVSSKSIDKNKRYAGIKTNDFVNKTRSNETSRATARTQGWANLGKINSRRIPPPANLPSLKSETGTNPPAFDPTISTGTSHGWTSTSGNQTPTNQIRPLTPSKQPTQQQLDSLPAHSSTPPLTQTTDLDKPRLPATWSNITAGNPADPTAPPSLLGLNDFPRLATQDNKNLKSTSDSLINSINTNNQGPSLRPANLASWKEGGGRAQPISNDANENSLSMQSQQPLPSSSSSSTTTTNTNALQSQTQNSSSYARMYPQQQQQQQTQQQMWSYNMNHPYGSNQYRVSHYNSNNQSHSQQQQQQQQRLKPTNDYKTPTILRNKDIDDLSKLTDNVTWASASQEVNYEEKILFSDDEDNEIVENNNTKSSSSTRRYNNHTQQSTHRHNYSHSQQNTNRSVQHSRSRLLQDDEHVKQMQDDKNSELINVLNVARQRRDEQQEHPNRDQRSTTTTTTKSNEQKQMPGYQTRPLLSSTGQENVSSNQIDSTASSLWTETNPGTNSTATTTSTAPTSRTRRDTTDSQTFAMKSWSDQMDSFNYASLHEKSNVQVEVDDEKLSARKSSRSPSQSSSQSQSDILSRSNQSKHFPLPNNRKTVKNTNTNLLRLKSKTTDVNDYFEQNNTDQWNNNDWEETNQRYQQTYNNDRRRQQISEDLTQKSTRFNEQTNDYNRTKLSTKTRTNMSSRSNEIPSLTTKLETKSSSAKSQQPAWRTLSPTRPLDVSDPTPQEAVQYKPSIKPNEITDRRQSAPTERKSRYATTPTPINTASIPPLMSVRSDLPPTTLTTTSKQYKTSNQSQRQDYNSSSHYSQRNDFYNDNTDSGWGNDDEYYDDETGYYDSNLSTHQRSMGYHTHAHHRGYTTLGSYGRYRRGGTLRHQQQYNTYNLNTTSNSSAQLNTSTGSKTKKILTNRTTTKKSTEPVKSVEETPKVVAEESVKKSSAWIIEPKSTTTSTVEEIPIVKSTETSSGTEKSNEVLSEQQFENESNLLSEQTTAETLSTNKKSTPTSQQKKTTKDQQNYYQNQQATRHRNTYSRSMQDYDNMQLSSQNYFGTTRRPRGARSQHSSSNYYYDHPQQRYSTRYSYSTDPYQQSHQTRSNTKTSKRGHSTIATTHDRQSTTTNTNNHQQKESISDNEQKEGEEWETASESSANMRPVHHDTNQQIMKSTTETKAISQERTPPKKSFTSQRPINARHNESTLHRRTHNLHDRGTKSTRGTRSNRLITSQKSTISQNTDDETSTTKQSKKDQHRHSLDGYDLNNVAGVVKIETLPAGALEEESTAFDDGGEEFCVVMSKRGRKEQKAAQLSKQNAIENPSIEQSSKSNSIDMDNQQTTEGTKSTEANSTRARNGKSLPPRFNSKSSNRQSKTDQMYYYDQNYYYYDQNQYYDENSYYNYNNYNQTHRQSSTRRKQQQQQRTQQVPTQQQQQQQQGQGQSQTIQEINHDEKKTDTEKLSSNVMSNIQMWDPHTDNKLSNPSKLIEKPIHDRKYTSEIDGSLPLQLTTHSPVSKTNENLARTIKPPSGDNKTDQKIKSANYEKTDTISSLGSNQLFEKSTFLDYDDKQSIGTVGDDYNQKINSLKTIWDISDHPSGQLEQTINSMVAMQQQQENIVQTSNSTKSDSYVKESIPTSSSTTTNVNVSSTATDETNNKNSSTNSNSSTGNMNSSTNYSTNTNTNKNEQKNICTVKPTQQVPPNIQDQVDVNAYQTFPVPPLPPPMSQPSLQQQQHLLPQSQVNPLHQQHSYAFYENLLPPPPPPQQQAQQQQYNRIYSSTTNSNSTDSMNTDFSNIQSSQLYPPQNFPYRNTNVYMPPPNVPNTNSIYHHASQGSISAPQQNNTMPPPMPSYPSPFLVDHGGHMISQPQPPPPPPPQAYINNQMMSGRPQGGPYYRTPPQQQLQTPPGPPYGTQDPLAHGGYYPPFFQPPNSNAPPVGHPSPHNLYGQNEGFHHPQMFARGGSIDRGDHPLMSQPLSRPTSYPSASSNQPPPQQQGPPPSLLSQNLKSFHTNQQQTSSSNQPQFYPPPNQYNRQSVPIGAMNTNNNRQQTQQVPSLMSGLTKNFSNNTSNMPNSQALFSHRQPLLPPQSTNNRPLYQHHNQYSSYSKTTTTNDDNVKPKHI